MVNLIRVGSQRRPIRTALLLIAIGFSGLPCRAQSSSTEPANQLWATFNASFELSERTRITAIFEKHNGEDDSLFGQQKVGVLFGYRMKRFGKHLTGDNDKENEYNLIVGGGYEFLITDQSGSSKREHRLVVQSTPKYVFGLGILAQDRNRLEFRWTGSVYNFRYRNRLTVERPFRIGRLRLSPYAAGELFWDRNHHAWNENEYAFGVQWPIRKIFKLNTYYLRQNCTTCGTDPLNVIGLTANFYFDWPGKR
jgi:hypothetical protein